MLEGGAAACPEKGIIMQTSVIGFPRIGTLRELKFASEKYFRGGNRCTGAAADSSTVEENSLEHAGKCGD